MEEEFCGSKVLSMTMLVVFVQTCLSNVVPCIVFRGVSDLAGRARKHASTRTSLSSLAAINALNVAVEFIGLLNKQVTITHDN